MSQLNKMMIIKPNMKSTIAAILLPFLLNLAAIAQEKNSASGEKVSVKLISGETISGQVGGIKDDSVSLITDYGVIRIPTTKISEESRQKIGIQPETELSKLKRRVSELEALVSSLREENATLRKKGTSEVGSNTNSTAPSPSQSSTPGTTTTANPPQPASSSLSYKLSKTGTRHNSRCRYYNSNGSTCGPNDGVPCKICGG
jgi:hypothetical protein